MKSKSFFIYFIMVCFVSFTHLFATKEANELCLMPFPAEMKYLAGTYRLQAEFEIAVFEKVNSRVCKAATNMLRRLSGRTGLFFPQAHISNQSKSENADFNIRVKRIGELKLFEDESYHLMISEKNINLEAETDIGVLRGLETFLQLLRADEHGYYFPAIEIMDTPRFPWRGLMIDVSRHFMPLEVLKRNLRAMAAVKLNVFHWHLTDDQGFRIECKTFPKLHEMGSDGFYYTHEQVKEVIAYAADFGIRIIPEFDIPAHTTSWFVGHPELASAPGPYSIERYWGVKDPTMDPSKESTYEFLDRFFMEMASLFPDEYMHIGGDENNGKQWNNNQEIKQFMIKNNIVDTRALQCYFTRRVMQILARYGKKMVGWDEIFHPQLEPGAMIQSWRGHESLYEAAKEGFYSILSRDYYIDLIHNTDFHYLNDPLPQNAPVDKEARKNILGGEVTSWGELVTQETIDSRIWPKTAAIAERLWSPQDVKDVDDMYTRLEIINIQLEELGLQHIKNYEMMLRRLSNYQDISALKIFVDVLEQVKNYDRHFQGVTYSSYAPLTRTVDAAMSQSLTDWKFNKLVADFLLNGSESYLIGIRCYLNLWQENHDKMLPIIANAPILREVETLSKDLKNIAEIGLQAIDIITGDEIIPSQWCAKSKEILIQARKPRGQVELIVIDAIERLVEKCCANSLKQ